MTPTSLNKVSRYAQWTDSYVDRLTDRDYACIILAYTPEGFVFDEDQANAIKDKPLVILDMREYGWNTSHKNDNIFGYSYKTESMYHGPEWEKLNEWGVENSHRIVCNFTREYSPQVSALTQLASQNFPVYPVDLISANRPNYPIQTKDEFLSRECDLMHWWGHSHEDRVDFHARASELPGVHYFNKVHHTERYPLAHVLDLQFGSKLSTAFSGCGVKTFRHSESCAGSVPVVMDVGMRYAVPWTSDNSSLLPTVDGRIDFGIAIPYLKKLIQNPELIWDKYEAAQESARQLDQNVYVNQHINAHIAANL